MEGHHETLASFRACLPVFATLADPIRQELVLLLAAHHEGLTVGALAEQSTLSRPAISHHLKLLRQAGMVDFRRQATEHYYFLTFRETILTLKHLVETAAHTCNHGAETP